LSVVQSRISQLVVTLIAIVILSSYSSFCLSAENGQTLSTTSIAIPGGASGIGFDDLGFSAELHKVIIPAAGLGKLDLIDPQSKQITEISGFSSQPGGAQGHGKGVTSADSGRGAIFATDRNSQTLNMIDPGSKKILAVTKLAAGPDYVRYVAATNEVWVTEPRAAQIEVFSLPENGFPEPEHAVIISVPMGPEALVIDGARGRAYSNMRPDTTVSIDLRKRAIVSKWPNGCSGSEGLAFDSVKGFLFVGCEEGKLESLSVIDGHRLGEVASGSGVDIIAYDAKLRHAYLPGAESATMAIIGISAGGSPTLLNTVATAKGSHCVTIDDLSNAYICDPRAGKILVFHDSLAPAK
jgi:hypothetical protein